MKVVNIFDFDFTVYPTMDAAAEAVVSFDSTALSPEKRPFLITPNVDDIVKWNRKQNQELRSEYVRSAFVLVDGQPLVTFSKLVGRSLERRLPGSSLFPLVWEKLKAKQQKAFLILAKPSLSKFFENEYVHARTYNPVMFDASDRQAINSIVAECSRIIEAEKPDFVFIGIQFPKQNILAVELSKAVKGQRMPLFLLLGASMAFYSGEIKRSPRIYQRLGLEWLYRLLQDPKRLAKRYLVDDMAIFGIFLRELFRKNSGQK